MCDELNFTTAQIYPEPHSHIPANPLLSQLP